MTATHSTERELKHAVLGELIRDVKPGFAVGERTPDGVIQVRMNNVDIEGNLDLTNAIRVPATGKQIATCSLSEGDVLFNNTNSTELVGKSAVFRRHDELVTFSNHFTRLRVHPGLLEPRYLARWLSCQQQHRVFEGLCTRWVGQSAVRSEKLLALEIPLPPLPEQKRIADILDMADAVRRKRREAISHAKDFLNSLFEDMFRHWLGMPTSEVPRLGHPGMAEIVSGVTKGRRFNGKETVEVPYIRVANVQDGFLDLSEIKTIEVLPADVENLLLQRGDVLMTEGGDHDKLGRGAMWEVDIPNCIHQNHVFRIRCNRDNLLPEYFAGYIQTGLAKAYFLRCAKKTSNLASINMTQLKATPVPCPPTELQRKYADIRSAQQKATDTKERALAETDELFNSLVHSAFHGGL